MSSGTRCFFAFFGARRPNVRPVLGNRARKTSHTAERTLARKVSKIGVQSAKTRKVLQTNNLKIDKWSSVQREKVRF